MQMLQIVALHAIGGDYQYQIAHLFIVSSTEGST